MSDLNAEISRTDITRGMMTAELIRLLEEAGVAFVNRDDAVKRVRAAMDRAGDSIVIRARLDSKVTESTAIPVAALSMSLDDFSTQYLAPVAGQLYAAATPAARRR